MADVYIHSMVDTWNSSGTSYDGIGIDVLDVASAADSKLINLKINGVQKFTVDKNGNLVAVGSMKAASLELTTALPIASGGTGGTSQATARTALGLGSAATAATTDFMPSDTDLAAIAQLVTTVFGRNLLTLADQAALYAAVGVAAAIAPLLPKAGGAIAGRLDLEPATLANNVGAANFAARNVYKASMSGAMTLTVSNLADGNDGQVNLAYTSGTLSFSGVTRWVTDNTATSTSFASTDVGTTGLVAGATYQFVFSNVNGSIIGRVGRVI